MLPLPTELWFEIGTQKCITRDDLRSLVLTSRLFLDLFTPLLYTNVRISPDFSMKLPHSASKYWLMASPSQLLLERLESSQQLQSYVRTFRLEKMISKFASGQKESMADIIALIGQLPNLSVLELAHAAYHSDWILHLATRPSLRLSIAIMSGFQVDQGKTVPELPYTARSLVIRDGDCQLMGHLIFQASLQHLELPGSHISKLVACHIKYGSPVLPSLQVLELGIFEKDVISLLKCTPNLVELKFRNGKPEDNLTFQDLKGIVPKLESFKGSRKILLLFTSGRPINSIHTWEDSRRLTSAPLHFLPKQFGSTVPIRTIHWEIYIDLQYPLDYIVTSCVHVQELYFIFKQQVNEVRMAACLHKLKNLKELRVLMVRFVDKRVTANLKELRMLMLRFVDKRVTANLKELCEALQREGCSQLTRLQFGDVVWTRHPDDLSWKS